MSTSPPQKKQKICGFNPKTEEWHCLECGVSMGKNNPRQLCGKHQCNNSYISSDDEDDSSMEVNQDDMIVIDISDDESK